MTSNILIQSPYEFFTDRTGRPLASGQIYIGLPGQDPENFPQNVYFDVAGAVPATQPVRTNVAGYPSDTTGNPQRIFVAGAYSIRVKDSNGVQVFYAQDSTDGFDGVYAADLANNTDPLKGSGMVGYVLHPGATGTNVHDKIARSWVDIKDFGAVGDGVTNDKAAFDAAASTGRSILLPAGSYNVPSGNYGTTRFYSFDGATCTNSSVAIVDPLANSLAVGAQVDFPCAPAALPFGWLHRNGAIINRSVYPQLWAFAQASGNIVDEVDKSSNPSAFGRGNGTSTFSLPDDRATNRGFADAGRGVDATFVLGKQVAVTAASAAPGITVRSSISTPAIRAFASSVNQGQIDIQALQAQVNGLPLKNIFISPEQTITAGGALTIAHGLGVKPRLIDYYLVCKTATSGFSVGDEVFSSLDFEQASAGVTTFGFQCMRDATNLAIRFGSAGIFLLNPSTGAFIPTTTVAANFRIVFEALA